jgi:hypothetical protein
MDDGKTSPDTCVQDCARSCETIGGWVVSSLSFSGCGIKNHYWIKHHYWIKNH